MHAWVLSCSAMSDSLQPIRLYPARLLLQPMDHKCQAPLPVDFSGKNTGVACHFLLQGIILTQRWNPHLCLLHCRQILYWLSHQGSPIDTLGLNQFSKFENNKNVFLPYEYLLFGCFPSSFSLVSFLAFLTGFPWSKKENQTTFLNMRILSYAWLQWVFLKMVTPTMFYKILLCILLKRCLLHHLYEGYLEKSQRDRNRE